MNVSVQVTQSFKKAVKPLLKKYPALHTDLLALESRLLANPRLGTPLGDQCYKIRLQITGKPAGKSGGARVISFVEPVLVGTVQVTKTEIVVYLVTIYDKSVTAAISDKELRLLIKALR